MAARSAVKFTKEILYKSPFWSFFWRCWSIQLMNNVQTSLYKYTCWKVMSMRPQMQDFTVYSTTHALFELATPTLIQREVIKNQTHQGESPSLTIRSDSSTCMLRRVWLSQVGHAQRVCVRVIQVAHLITLSLLLLRHTKVHAKWTCSLTECGICSLKSSQTRNLTFEGPQWSTFAHIFVLNWSSVIFRLISISYIFCRAACRMTCSNWRISSMRRFHVIKRK